MANFTFKNSSNSLSANTFQEWVEGFKTLFLSYHLAKSVAFHDTDNTKRGNVLDAGMTCAVFIPEAGNRVNVLADKRLWGRFNKPMISLTKAEVTQVVTGEAISLARKNHSFAVKYNGAKTVLSIRRAYKAKDSDAVFEHNAGLLVDLPADRLTDIAGTLKDNPTAPKTDQKERDSVDLSDFE